MTFKVPNFTQLRNYYTDKLMRTVSPATTLVMNTILRYTAGYLRREAAISLSHIQEMTNLSKQGVLNCLATLDEKGWIRIHKNPRKTNVYELVMQDDWPVHSVDNPSQHSGQAEVNSVDTINKGKKVRINKYPPKAPPKGEPASPDTSQPPDDKKASYGSDKLVKLTTEEFARKGKV